MNTPFGQPDLLSLILTDRGRLAYGPATGGPPASGAHLRGLLRFRRFWPRLSLAGLAGLVLLASACKRAPAPSSRVIWAEVDGVPIFRDQVERIYRSGAASRGEPGDHEEVLSYELNILNDLINKQVLLAHAAHAGITVSEAEVDTQIAQLKSPYTKKEFERRLKDRGLQESDLREEIRSGLTVDKLINKDIESRISVPDGEIAAYYEQNKSSFSVPETEYHLAQIEVTPGASGKAPNLKNDDAKTPAMAKHKIQALYAQVRAGQDFAQIAQEYSEDPATSSSGGDMGFVPISSLDQDPQLARVVKSLKVGQVSGILKSAHGYHIIKLLGIEQAGQRQLSDPKVQGSIRKTLHNEKEQLLKAAYIENLRDHAKVRNLLAEQVVKNGSDSVK